MGLNGGPYRFRPAAVGDLPLLAAWLREPEVACWWQDADKQLELLREDLADPRMVMRIVSFEARPFAYVQDYEVHAWEQPHLAAFPVGTRGIDTFIGDPAMLGRGHGPAYLRLLAQHLRAEGAPMVVVDPDPANRRAQAAYAKAGFQARDLVATEDGPARLMVFV
ncbi:GNAT family N-acetyltransferase [Labrys sp. (in: a-proteobacteria)]|uniref:GNAT family N-acetyltransferase n=1 Tax=Labrys sp. (in: a-proteobacteria) TaxID=1917972 RepID=UPI0039E59DB6